NAQWQTLTGKQFFPNLISSPFHHGLVIVFSMAIALSVVGALFSALRGRRYVHADDDAHDPHDLHDPHRQREAHRQHEHLGNAALTSGAVPGELALEDEIAFEEDRA
ncbi:MAG: hypothetical protein QOH29_2214, partial [Actinomycetota bacterium]|nr:hypothetical protein [Actinomycetota bacterium]